MRIAWATPLNLPTATMMCIRCGKQPPRDVDVDVPQAIWFFNSAMRFAWRQLAATKLSSATRKQYEGRFWHWWDTPVTFIERELVYRRGILIGLAIMLKRIGILMRHALQNREAKWFRYLADLGIRMLKKAEGAGIAQYDGASVFELPYPTRLESDAEHEPDHRLHASKRIDLNNFRGREPSWEDRMLVRMLRTKYGEATAVTMCTGLRPRELEHGVIIMIHNQELVFMIRGAKTHGGKYGQPYRWIRLPIMSPEAKFLARNVKEVGGVHLVQIESAAAFKDSMAYQSRQEWPAESYVVTPYSWRHHIRDHAEQILSMTEISQWMGHCSIPSQAIYGTGWSPGSAWRNPIREVAGSNPVRDRENVIERLAARFKQSVAP